MVRPLGLHQKNRSNPAIVWKSPLEQADAAVGIAQPKNIVRKSLPGSLKLTQRPLNKHVIANLYSPQVQKIRRITSNICHLASDPHCLNSQELLRELRVEYSRNYFAVMNMITKIRLLGQQSQKVDYEKMAYKFVTFLEKYRDCPLAFVLFHDLLNLSEIKKLPHREIQTPAETLDLAIGGAELYFHLNKTPQPAVNDFHANPFQNKNDLESLATTVNDELSPIVRVPIDGTDYFFEIREGIQESRGGLDFYIVDQQGSKISTVSALFGTQGLVIVNIQGKNGFRDNKLIRYFKGRSYHDWLIHNLINWARVRGFAYIRGYDYMHNSWIRYHFQAQDRSDFGEEKKAALERMYNLRFLSHGLTPLADRPAIFERQLTPLDSRDGIRDIDLFLLRNIPAEIGPVKF